MGQHIVQFARPDAGASLWQFKLDRLGPASFELAFPIWCLALPCTIAPMLWWRRTCDTAFSVSSSNAPAVIQYIRTQQAHHKKMRFEPEFLALLKKHGVEFDPKFVFG